MSFVVTEFAYVGLPISIEHSAVSTHLVLGVETFMHSIITPHSSTKPMFLVLSINLATVVRNLACTLVDKTQLHSIVEIVIYIIIFMEV